GESGARDGGDAHHEEVRHRRPGARLRRAGGRRAVTFPERSGPTLAIMSSKGWSVVLGGIAAASLAAMIPLSVLAQLLGEGVVALVIGVPCMAVGFVVARRPPRTP